MESGRFAMDTGPIHANICGIYLAIAKIEN